MLFYYASLGGWSRYLTESESSRTRYVVYSDSVSGTRYVLYSDSLSGTRYVVYSDSLSWWSFRTKSDSSHTHYVVLLRFSKLVELSD